jgi:hypothetical protein
VQLLLVELSLHFTVRFCAVSRHLAKPVRCFATLFLVKQDHLTVLRLINTFVENENLMLSRPR